MRLADGVTLYFVRHGQTEWNRLRRLQGHIDIPLNDTGRAQAANNGRRLREVAGDSLDGLDYVASPLMRTTETMEIVREAAGLPRAGYRTDPDLREVNYGHWEGAYLDELKQQDPQGFNERRFNKFHWQPRGGESYAQLEARVGAWLATMTRNAVVVSHGGVSRVLRGLVDHSIDRNELPNLEVPQDRVMKVVATGYEWL